MDQKTSLLINRQVPEFIREEYPLFISFLEAYYQFLEKEQFTNGVSQKNNLNTKSKDLRYVSDIDYSLDQFEQQFFDTFIPLLPAETAVNKDFLIKNILPLYRSKGTEKSFQFFFRLLFDKEISIEYPRKQILRASDAKWSIENLLKTENVIYSEYVSDGITKEYYLPYELNTSEVQLYVNDVLQNEIAFNTPNGTYNFRKEYKKIVFINAPTSGSLVKILYNTPLDLTIFNNCGITGLLSGTNTVISKSARRNIAGLNFLQFFINSKDIVGQFKNGELVRIDVVVDNRLLNFYLQSISDVESLTIQNPGSNYSVGDELVFSGQAKRQAIAVVDRVSSAVLESLRLKIGLIGSGAGYKVGNNVYITNIPANNFVSFIAGVDTTGTNSPNTISYNTDSISDYSNTTINAADYNFRDGAVENVNTRIANALNYITLTGLGPAINVIISSSGGLLANENLEFVSNSSIIVDDIEVADLASIGTIQINNGGEGYRVGDNLVFTNTQYFSGQGASAHVSQVSPLTGGITRIRVTNGGYNYRKDTPPTITVDSISGQSANLAIGSLMGAGAEFEYDKTDGVAGKILSIELLDRGSTYTSLPIINLTSSGDGNAIVTAQTSSSYVTLPGRWLTSDSILSSDESKLQGEDYYIDFSYIISSQVEFRKYKNIVRDLMNPSGMINYARYSLVDNINSELNVILLSSIERQLTGTVNVSSGRIEVYGTDTYFQLANTLGILGVGSYIIVNSEMMVVNSIINNTYLTVSESYAYNANDVIISTMDDFDTITTEGWVGTEIEGGSRIYITTENKEHPEFS
jgi:hypothetical protein